MSFKNYISRILITFSISSISAPSKKYTNDILINVANKIISTTILLLKDKNTVNVQHLQLACRLLFSNDLQKNILNEGAKAIQYSLKEYQKIYIFPSSKTKTLIRQNVPSNFQISRKCGMFLASVMEYLCFEILNLGHMQSLKSYNPVIHPKHLYDGCMYDNDISSCLSKCEIRLLRCENEDVLPKSSFQKLVKQTFYSIENESVKTKPEVLNLLQIYMEDYILDILKKSKEFCLQANKIRLQKEDIMFVKSFLK